MEVSGVVSRQVPSFSGAGIDTGRPFAQSFHGGVRVPGRRDFGVSLRTGGFSGRLNCGFRDEGHVQYYQVGPMCGGDKMKEKEIKKKMKLIKGLKELASSSQMGFGSGLQEGLVAEIQGKLISEGGEALLLKQLEQLRAEEKEMKKKRKEGKARLKAERMKTVMDSESSSSSSSSESSDGECGEVVDMNLLRGEIPAQPIPDALPAHKEGALLILPGSLTANEETITMGHGIEICSSQTQAVERCIEVGTSSSTTTSSIGFNGSLSSSVVGAASGMKIEVCMGNKCKKSGGGELLEEFQRVMDGEATVVGCKCMGKCKNGPNVRVSGTLDGIKPEGRDDSVRTPVNPLYIGVGLEDVSLIASNLIGEDKNDLGLVAAA